MKNNKVYVIINCKGVIMRDNNNVNEMSIKELAEFKGLTFQTILRYIRKNDIKEVSVKNRAKYYNVNDFVNIKNKNVNENVNEKDDIIKILNEQIDYLKIQLEQKDTQINKLQIIVDQQQKLELLEKTNIKKNKLLFWKK